MRSIGDMSPHVFSEVENVFVPLECHNHKSTMNFTLLFAAELEPLVMVALSVNECA